MKYFFPVVVLAMTAACGFHAGAADIRVLAGSAILPVTEIVVPAFEKESGHKVAFEWGAAGGMAQRVARGDAADVAFVTTPQMDELEKAGRVVPGTRVEVGRTGVGAFVKKGAAKPPMGTVEEFRRTMLAARSIGYNDPAAGAPVSIYLIGLFDRMGIGEAMRAKTVVFKQRSERFDAVARGDVDIGFNQVSEIIAVPSVDLASPLPEAIQNYTPISGALVANAVEPEAAKALLRYLARPEVLREFHTRGFQATGR